MARTVTTVTTSDLREWFRADEKRMARLSPEARKTVEKGARGTVHAEAVKVHNTRRQTRIYTLGATKSAREVREAQRATLVKAGLAGKRGPLSTAAKEYLAQQKG